MPANTLEAPAETAAASTAAHTAPQPPLSAPIGDRFGFDRLELPDEIRAQLEPPPEPTPAPAAPAAEEASVAAAEDDPAAPAAEPVAYQDDWPDSAKARIDHLKIRRDAEKTKNAELQSKLETAEAARLAAEQRLAAPAPKAAPDPQPQMAPALPVHIARLTDEAQLIERVNTARQVLRFAKLHRDGAEDVFAGLNPDGSEKREDYSPQRIAQMEVDAEDELQIHLPVRAQQLAAEKQAAQARPFWDETFKEEYGDAIEENPALAQGVEILLQNFPMLAGMPDGRLTAADIVSKSLERAGRLQSKHTAAPRSETPAPVPGKAAVDPSVAAFLERKPPRAPSVPRSGSSAPPPAPPNADGEAAQARYLADPTPENYRAWMQASKPLAVASAA